MKKKTKKKAAKKAKKDIVVKLDMSFEDAIDLALRTPIKKKKK